VTSPTVLTTPVIKDWWRTMRSSSLPILQYNFHYYDQTSDVKRINKAIKKHTNDIYRSCMPMHHTNVPCHGIGAMYLYHANARKIIVMRYLISQVWSEEKLYIC